MATPRIFISSTCYDLQEIRFQLRRFIEEIGYEPVMSESGDVFYDIDKHIHDACKMEIGRSNMFVLIIGNSYGSIYHHHRDGDNIPDSVTLQEFRKALDVGIPKYIFINRLVQHDFENYHKALAKHFKKYFSETKVENDKVDQVKKGIREKFDTSYPFPQDAYKYVFYFLEILYNLEINNAVYPFESFENIRDLLRKQWAGYLFDSLTKETTVAIECVEALGKRLDRIEHQLRLIAEGTIRKGDSSKITIDLRKLASDFKIADLELMQDKISENVFELLYQGQDCEYQPRIKFKAQFDNGMACKLFDKIGELIQNYKWSKFIPITEIFILSEPEYAYYKNRIDVPYKVLFELFGIYNKLEETEKDAFLNTVCLRLNELYEPKKEKSKYDDVPF